MRRVLVVLLFAAVRAFGETIVGPCGDEAPDTPYEFPQCADYELHSALIACVETGDASAVALLRKRYALADTHRERHRIAGTLLRFAPDDTAIWRDVYAEAELAVRFANDHGEIQVAFEEWCEARDFDPYLHGQTLNEAFIVAAKDPRSQPLLVKALATDDENIVFAAIAGLAEQRDLASLPAIESAIEGLHADVKLYAALILSAFKSERADAIAMKFFEDEDDLELYRKDR